MSSEGFTEKSVDWKVGGKRKKGKKKGLEGGSGILQHMSRIMDDKISFFKIRGWRYNTFLVIVTVRNGRGAPSTLFPHETF